MIDDQTAAAAAAPCGYQVRLDNFEGPLDLLLHLIQQDEVEIWAISLARITQQYLDYLDRMRALNIEIAGEFLVMAATLMRIKSRRLLPRIEPADDDQPATEEELIERLLTYKSFKEAAALLRTREEETGSRFPRGYRPMLPDDYEYPLADVDLYTLIAAFNAVQSRPRAGDEPVHQVRLEDVRLEDRVAEVLSRLEAADGKLPFERLFDPGASRLEIAVTLLAILELARQQVVTLLQHLAFGEIWVFARVRESATIA
jgi:segregation and condensation protein A